MKTNFSFEVQYLAQSGAPQAERDALMQGLGPSLQALLARDDPGATVRVSSSHKGSDNKIVELSTRLQDAQIAALLQAFSGQHGVAVTALE
ncbi:hypothetical protein [Polaromonas sp.]|uniref:hypothetical protein n=1 Tax=Polaromonas sp. TaxID=1869339 RepID=UPI00286B1CCD|nr:hypothetical protein [Polaromonas sp.]